jgi:hypothetical protein
MPKLHIDVLGESFDVTVSPSFLAEATCPFAVREKRILKTVRVSSPNLEVGTAMHALFEAITKLRIAGNPVDDAAMDLLYKELVPPLAIPFIGEIREMTRKYLTNFYVPPDTIAGIEEEIILDQKGKEVHSWDDAWIGGILDLVQIKGDSARVTDYKTQHNILSRSELDKHLQITFYLMLLRAKYPHLKRFEGGIYYNRHGFSMYTERSAQQLDDCEAEVALRILQIRNWKDFNPVAGEHCTICDSHANCPIANDVSDLPDTIATEEQAKAVSSRLRVQEIVGKKIKALLKAYCAENGSVMVGDKYGYGHVFSSSLDYPAEAVVEKMQAHNIVPGPYLQIDRRQIKKLFKTLERSDPTTYADIASVCTERGKTSFKGFKPGGDDEEGDE